MLSRQRPNKDLAIELPWKRLSIVGNQVVRWRLLATPLQLELPYFGTLITLITLITTISTTLLD
jgi:hypothetical protein